MAGGTDASLPRHRTRRRYPQSYHVRLPFLSRFVFQIPHVDLSGFLNALADCAMYILGPILIVVVFGIIGVLTHTFYYVILPLMSPNGYWTPVALFHQAIVFFFIFNILFNYISCVTTRNDKPVEKYDAVVKELALATGYEYPTTQEGIERWKNEYKEMILNAARRKREYDRLNLMRRYDLADTLEDESNVNKNGSQNSAIVGSKNNDTATLSTPASSSGNGKVIQRRVAPIQSRQNDVATNNPTTSASNLRPWMLLGPNSWGYCEKSKLPKPPRSHFDYVTRSLVMNMDHYCPWMFNVIGYFNYRYFVNFLLYVSTGMMYGTLIIFKYFMKFDSKEYIDQIAQSREKYVTNFNHNNTMVSLENIHGQVVEPLQADRIQFHMARVEHLIPDTPTPHERLSISFAFMICAAVGFAVSLLLGFHLYLILTSQTTIEFHGNMMKKRRCKEDGTIWKNPYDLGRKRNIEQIWGRIVIMEGGKGHRNDDDVEGRFAKFKVGIKYLFAFLRLLLPSRREPEFLPVPLKGDIGRRKKSCQVLAGTATGSSSSDIANLV